MKELFVKKPSEAVVGEINEWLGSLTTGPIILSVNEVQHLVNGACNLLIVEGTNDETGSVKSAIEMALKVAERVAPNYVFMKGERYIVQLCYNIDCPLILEELDDLQKFFETLPERAYIAWGISPRKMDDKVLVRILVANIPC